MDLDCFEHAGQRYAAGPEHAPLMQTAEDVIRLIEASGACEASAVLLFAENLPPGFVDLSTGVAGHVLLKLQLYQVRLALVLPLATTPHSEHFAAAVSFVPFVDIRTKWLTSDIPWEFYLVHYQEQWPWQQPGLLADRSPPLAADRPRREMRDRHRDVRRVRRRGHAKGGEDLALEEALEREA